jgi:hypothetical protein
MLDVRDLRPPARPDASKPFAWRITALESSSLSSTMRVMSYPPISRLRWRRTKHLNVKRLLVHDDISGKTNPRRPPRARGFPPVFKIAGATAEQGLPLDRCLELAERMGGNTRTLFVTLRTATHPTTGQPIFDLGDDEMEIGMGQHGEAGTGRTKMKTPMRQPSSCCRCFRTTSRFSGMTICSSS